MNRELVNESAPVAAGNDAAGAAKEGRKKSRRLRKRDVGIVNETSRYENWLRRQIEVDEVDLQVKHRLMAEDGFRFLRATYYRWASCISDLFVDLAHAPEVVAVGDVHLENYGTWRDAAGRLVWGINDFDEAARMPYTWDLLRLATSAMLAPNQVLSPTEIASAILRGYAAGLASPQPCVVQGARAWLLRRTRIEPGDDRDFWAKESKGAAVMPPDDVRTVLDRSLPSPHDEPVYRRRFAGGGARGHRRYTVMASWQGGLVLHEAKSWTPSAWDWARGRESSVGLQDIAAGRYRSPDPWLKRDGGYVVRRLAPDNRKLDLVDVKASVRANEKVLGAMAWDLAAIHAGEGGATRIDDDLKRLPSQWLQRSSVEAARWVKGEHRVWRRWYRQQPDTARGASKESLRVVDTRAGRKGRNAD